MSKIQPVAWVVEQRPGQDYDTVVYLYEPDAIDDADYSQSEGYHIVPEPLWGVDPNPLFARIRELESCLRAAKGKLEHYACVPEPGHICGPEGNCDMMCMEAARDAEFIEQVRKTLGGAS